MDALKMRTKANMTRREVSLATGISEQAIHNIEKGIIKSPGSEFLIRLANLYCCTLDELLGREVQE
jgi:transcriptional regulator with XRE-family HTH domain